MKIEEDIPGREFKNNIDPLLIAVRTSRTVTHEETIDPKEFKKLKQNKEKMNGLKKNACKIC